MKCFSEVLPSDNILGEHSFMGEIVGALSLYWALFDIHS